MPRSINPRARTQVQSSEIQDVILVVLDIDHTSLSSPIRVVNNTQGIEWNGNTYEASSFKFKPPAQEEGELSNATLTLSNIDRRIMETVRSIDSAPTVTANVVFVKHDELDPALAVVKEAGPWAFDLSEVRYDAKSITGTLTLNLKPKQTLSTVRVTFSNFPGLVQV